MHGFGIYSGFALVAGYLADEGQPPSRLVVSHEVWAWLLREIGRTETLLDGQQRLEPFDMLFGKWRVAVRPGALPTGVRGVFDDFAQVRGDTSGFTP